MGEVAPGPSCLEFLSEVTRADDTLLIFDEVMTGFRRRPATKVLRGL